MVSAPLQSPHHHCKATFDANLSRAAAIDVQLHSSQEHRCTTDVTSMQSRERVTPWVSSDRDWLITAEQSVRSEDQDCNC